MFDESGSDNDRRVEETRELIDQLDGVEMSDWESGFVEDIVDRMHKYGDKTFISPKQLFKLRDIVDDRT